jgi:hypothetical protein
MAIPIHVDRGNRSCCSAHAATAMNTGVVETRSTDEAMLVSLMELIQVAKCTARKAPATIGMRMLRPSTARRRLQAKGASTEAPAAQRQNAIANG